MGVTTNGDLHSVHTRHLARVDADATRDATRLPAEERYWLRTLDPSHHACQLCGRPVYPKNGMWFDWTGELHNWTCRGDPA
jgi:hypothetical protein